ncbi:MAG: sensor histidine kinase [Bacteroidota bacterium]
MDDAQEGFLLIATSTIVSVAFVLTVLAVMIIYRKRKVEYMREINRMNEKFTHELLQTQLEVQQQTMRHIGREIHDNVGQQLTLAFLYTQQLHSTDEKIEGQIRSVATIINESLTDLRNLSRNLTSTDSMYADLCSIIHSECSKVQATGLCQVNFETNIKQLEASQAVKSFVLRILQEFLQNSLKHSRCSVIQVKLQVLNDGEVELSAEDNGKGFSFNTNSLQEPIGIGLKNMKKRAEIIGALFLLDSVPERGTKMQLRIPADKFINQPWNEA